MSPPLDIPSFLASEITSIFDAEIPPEWKPEFKLEQKLKDKYLSDPVSWVEDKLSEHLWSKQKQIMQSVRDNRRTAVKSCHDVGKSYIASRIALCHLDNYPIGEAFCITTAPTASQVRAVLWREINRGHAKGKLKGRTNQTELWCVTPHGNEEMIAFGRKPSDMDPSAFQGIHAKYPLVIIDEGGGVPAAIFNAADTLITNDNARILVIGNPDDPATEFFEICKPGSGWNVIRISAFDSPNFTKEKHVPNLKPILDYLISPVWVEEKRKKWGVDNPLYISKVLGEFPEISTDRLIPITWIRAAQQRYLERQESSNWPDKDSVELGVDVGGGGDKSTIAKRHGPVVRVIHRDQNPNTMATLSKVLHFIEEHNASKAKIDNIGIGHGAVDRAQEMSEDQSLKRDQPNMVEAAKKIVGVNVGERAEDNEHYANVRAEGFWALRERFREGTIDIDPSDEDLAAQLADIKYKRSAGRIQIESKVEMKKRGKASPDDADAVMLAFLKEKETVKEIEVSW